MSRRPKCRFCERRASIKQRTFSAEDGHLIISPLCKRCARKRPHFEIIAVREHGHWLAFNDTAWKKRTKGAM